MAGVVFAVVVPLGACMACFAGPLVMEAVDGDLPGQANTPASDLLTWVMFRNLVIAPVAEEYVFRGLFMAALSHAGFSSPVAIAIPPLCFGAAHLHFHFDGKAFGQLALQLGYTSIFGLYSGLLFAATSSIYPPIVVHAFCNFMGFPDFPYLFDHPRKSLIVSVLFAGVAIFVLSFSSVVSPSTYRSFPLPLPPPPSRHDDDFVLVCKKKLFFSHRSLFSFSASVWKDGI